MNSFLQPQTELAAGIRFFGLVLLMLIFYALVQCSVRDAKDEIKQACAEWQNKP